MRKTITLKISTDCNIACTYCYEKNNNKDRGFMSNAVDIISRIIDVSLKSNTKPHLTFVLHGGEPLLMGKDFYKQIISALDLGRNKGCELKLALQTNGVLIDKDWVKLFEDSASYLSEGLGISIDGPQVINDKYRLTVNKESTFKKVYQTINLLKENDVNFGILMVVARHNVNNARDIFEFILENELDGINLIPCVDTTLNQGMMSEYAINPIEYANFLTKLFDIYANYNNLDTLYIEPLATIIEKIIKKTANFCEYSKRKCQDLMTIYPTGDMYQCSKLMDDRYLGNINTVDNNNLYEALNNTKVSTTNLYSILDVKCNSCSIQNICSGGCVGIRKSFLKSNKALFDNYCDGKHLIIEHIQNALSALNSEINN